MTGRPPARSALLAALVSGLVLLGCAPPPPVTGLGPDGLYPVAVPRTSHGTDPCALLTPDEAERFLGPDFISYPYNDDRCTFVSARDLGYIDLITELHSFDTPGPLNAPNATIAGYPALVDSPGRHCEILVVLNPEPGRANLGVLWPGQPDCDAVAQVVELVIPRIPLRSP